MISLLFVCHGNICRSPMAEFVMKDIVSRHKKEHLYHIESAATTTDEMGNDMYPPVRHLLKNKNISFTSRSARLFTKEDYTKNDYILVMDQENLYDLRRITDNDPKGKISLLLSFCGESSEVADPWYTRDFETTYHDIYRGCKALFEKIECHKK